MKLNEVLLQDYAANFFGYGNPHKTLWFIGIEEAGGKTPEVVERRLATWSGDFNRKAIVDGDEFHQRLELSDTLFDRPKRLQRTWAALCRLQMAYEGREINRKNIRTFLKEDWCRRNSASCLLEILPLPTPKAKKQSWPYGEWVAENSDFKERKTYVSKMVGTERDIGPRIHGIKELIAKYHPKIVIFYTSSMKQSCSMIADSVHWKDCKISMDVKIMIVRAERTLFALIKHPNARGLPKQYFERIGQRLRHLTD